MVDTEFLIVLFIFIFILFTEYSFGAFDCATGYWGSNCHEVCGRCEGGPEFCQVFDGLCMNGCGRGYKGHYCKTKCEPGFYGQFCRSECGHCSDVSPVCSAEYGRCLAGCKPGYQMPYCKIPCPFGTYGDKCASNCTCADKCGCDHVTGKCLPCEIDGTPRFFYRKEIPNISKLPYMPLLSALGFVVIMASINFVYWFIFVRDPKKKKSSQHRRRQTPAHHRREEDKPAKRQMIYKMDSPEELDAFWTKGWEKMLQKRAIENQSGGGGKSK
ncbi:multiple epidermal growth factor-like domains protein 10 [Aplysia californica]|uniref:Multiple epidermal growth factor-like domains protein 10 n=1 Tax=Aplysia californica TaxID=6500 RepID=A0ABM1AD77_APLCA|nr:multiple epidermal growth factor-like domains protein 10 [Aplysia californica]